MEGRFPFRLRLCEFELHELGLRKTFCLWNPCMVLSFCVSEIVANVFLSVHKTYILRNLDPHDQLCCASTCQLAVNCILQPRTIWKHFLVLPRVVSGILKGQMEIMESFQCLQSNLKAQMENFKKICFHWGSMLLWKPIYTFISNRSFHSTQFLKLFIWTQSPKLSATFFKFSYKLNIAKKIKYLIFETFFVLKRQ